MADKRKVTVKINLACGKEITGMHATDCGSYMEILQELISMTYPNSPVRMLALRKSGETGKGAVYVMTSSVQSFEII